jgi:hypothetical protein
VGAQHVVRQLRPARVACAVVEVGVVVVVVVGGGVVVVGGGVVVVVGGGGGEGLFIV